MITAVVASFQLSEQFHRRDFARFCPCCSPPLHTVRDLLWGLRLSPTCLVGLLLRFIPARTVHPASGAVQPRLRSLRLRTATRVPLVRRLTPCGLEARGERGGLGRSWASFLPCSPFRGSHEMVALLLRNSGSQRSPQLTRLVPKIEPCFVI